MTLKDNNNREDNFERIFAQLLPYRLDACDLRMKGMNHSGLHKGIARHCEVVSDAR